MDTNIKQFPTETIDLPSMGYFYPTDNPLSSGKIEIRYMTAREEDILTSVNLVKKGLAIDMVLRSIIVSPIDYDSLLIGDKNAIMVASRILAYGSAYDVDITCPSCQNKTRESIDLSSLQHKIIDFNDLQKGVNEFEFVLPSSKTPITFKFLTSGDEKIIDGELKGLKKVGVGQTFELSTRYKHIITSVNRSRDIQTIVTFVDKNLLAGDSLALRKQLAKVQPDVDMSFEYLCKECDYSEKMSIPLTVEFFWPDAGGQK